jgi:hypothetical protein
MIVALIHWRIKPDTKNKNAFIKHWKTNNFIPDRTGLIAEFLSDSMKIADFPWITWHLDPESLSNFKSYVTVGLWQDSIHFKDQVANYFNDDKPMLPFEKYRRRRVIFHPVGWRIGESELPKKDSKGVK